MRATGWSKSCFCFNDITGSGCCQVSWRRARPRTKVLEDDAIVEVVDGLASSRAVQVLFNEPLLATKFSFKGGSDNGSPSHRRGLPSVLGLFNILNTRLADAGRCV